MLCKFQSNDSATLYPILFCCFCWWWLLLLLLLLFVWYFREYFCQCVECFKTWKPSDVETRSGRKTWSFLRNRRWYLTTNLRWKNLSVCMEGGGSAVRHLHSLTKWERERWILLTLRVLLNYYSKSFRLKASLFSCMPFKNFLTFLCKYLQWL